MLASYTETPAVRKAAAQVMHALGVSQPGFVWGKSLSHYKIMSYQ